MMTISNRYSLILIKNLYSHQDFTLRGDWNYTWHIIISIRIHRFRAKAKYVSFISKNNELNFSSSHLGWNLSRMTIVFPNLSQMNRYLSYFGCFECFLKINTALKKACGLYEKSSSGLVDCEFEKKLRAVRRRRVLDPLLFLETRVCGRALKICLRCVRH